MIAACDYRAVAVKRSPPRPAQQGKPSRATSSRRLQRLDIISKVRAALDVTSGVVFAGGDLPRWTVTDRTADLGARLPDYLREVAVWRKEGMSQLLCLRGERAGGELLTRWLR